MRRRPVLARLLGGASPPPRRGRSLPSASPAPPTGGVGVEETSPRTAPRAHGWECRTLLAASAAQAVMLALYLSATMRLEFDSDWGAKNIIASLMLDQGRFFLQGFGYWNDLWILQGQLPLLLLIPLFGNNLLSNALASATCVAILLPLLYLFLRRLEVDSEAALLGTLIVSCGFSEEWVSFMYGQAAYGYACLFLLIVLFAASEGLLAPSSSPLRTGLLVSTSLLCGLAGPRTLVTLAIPAGLALAALRFAGRATRLRRGPPVLAATGLVVGLAVRTWVTSTIVFHEFGSWWLGSGESVGGGLTQAVVSLFGLLPSEPIVTDEPWGLVFPARALFAVGLAVSCIAGCRRPATNSDRRRFLALVACTSGLLTVYLTLTVEVLAGKSRFLMPPTFLFMLVAAQGLDRLAASLRGRRALALAAVSLVGLSFATYVAPLLPAERGGVPWQHHYERVRRLDRLIAALDDLGVKHAYASYANSAALTVLSGSRIEARQVRFVNGLPHPDPLLSLATWYTDDRGPATALLVDLGDPAEREQLSLERLSLFVGPPAAVDEREGFLVVRYLRNVFPGLPSWQKENMEAGVISRAVFGPASAQTVAGVGRLEHGCLVSTGKPGVLVYGPYIRLRQGSYRVRLRLALHGDGGSPGGWDISVDQPRLLYAHGVLPQAPSAEAMVVDETIEVSPSHSLLPLEVRVFSSGRGRICYRQTEIVRLPEQEPEAR